MKTIILSMAIVLIVFQVGCSSTNPLQMAIKEQPLWKITKIEDGEATHILKHNASFNLYGANKLGGSFAVNNFGGTMSVFADGKVIFGDVGITSRAGEQDRMKEEDLVSSTFLKANHVTLEGTELIFTNKEQKLKVTCIPGELGYMENLKSNKWNFLGYLKTEKDIAVMHASVSEHHKNMEKSKFTAFLECTGSATYDKNSDSLLYKVLGNTNSKNFDAELAIDKNSGKMRIQNLKYNSEQDLSTDEEEFISLLSKLTNFSFAHDNVYMDTSEYKQIIFTAQK